MKSLVVRDLGLTPYPEALELMRATVALVARCEAPETLLVATHPPVITVGRKRGAERNILAAGEIPVVPVERGGDVTYHGPGQVVLYPIIRLTGPDRDLRGLLRRLEETVIRALAMLGVRSGRRDGLTGVWVGERKIASLGVAVRNWVVYHGVALNVAPDPGFGAIRACGLDGAVMTSLEAETGRSWPRAAIVPELAAAFCAEFDYLEDRP